MYKRGLLIFNYWLTVAVFSRGSKRELLFLIDGSRKITPAKLPPGKPPPIKHPLANSPRKIPIWNILTHFNNSKVL